MALLMKRRAHAALLALLMAFSLIGPACVFDTDDDADEVEQVEDDEDVEDDDADVETEVEVEDEETP
ncbi:MAG TPA: hypothetical protein VG408_03315 [Actinomycetota bacterium]|nr:hypothetical protein [Actinomycetota bacterium]